MSDGTASVSTQRRLDALQVGRGIAAAMVVIDHALLHNLRVRPETVPMLGVYGVTLFFLISGFIMVKVSGAGTFRPGRFLIHRFQRIAPLYYVACALLAAQVLIAPWAFKSTHLEFWHVLRSILFIPAYSPTAGAGFITPFYQLGWTLNFEMFFYVVFASLFFLRSTQRVIALTVLFVGLMIMGQTVHFDQAIPRFYTQIDLASFLAGAWLGLWSQRGEIVLGPRAATGLFAVSLALLFYVMLHFHENYGDNLPLRLAMLTAAALHIAILVGYFDRLRKPIAGPLLLLGDASYSMYLFHMFAIGPIVFIGRKLGPAFLVPSILAAAVAGLIAGLIAYWWIERPITAWIRQRRPASDSPIAPAAPAPAVPAPAAP